MKQNVEIEKYHYLKTKRGKVPVVTFCVIKQGNEYARGFSVLSLRDKLDIKEGKRHARGSALQALGTGENGKVVVRNDALDVLDLVDITPYKNGKKLYKSQYNPILTKIEKRLLEEI